MSPSREFIYTLGVEERHSHEFIHTLGAVGKQRFFNTFWCEFPSGGYPWSLPGALG